MKKKSYQGEFEKIDVPKDEVFQAIHSGVKRGERDRTPVRKKKYFRNTIISVSAAAVVFFSSGFISPAISQALSHVPVLGQLYGGFHDAVGEDLESQKLITKLNKTASSQGIDVSITSAYYDGATIGITFKADGDFQTEPSGRFRAFYEVFGNDTSISPSMETKELADTRTTDDGHTGHILLMYPKQELPGNATVPITFMEIGDTKGKWAFNVPIKQLPFETVKTAETSSSKDGKVNVTFDSIIAGASSTVINFTAVFPKEGKHDQILMDNIYDDQGNRVHVRSTGTLESTKENGHVVKKMRTVISQSLKGKTDYIRIAPHAALSEKDQFFPLNRKAPFDIKSDRQDLSVSINKLTVKGHSVAVDFQFNHGENHNKDFSFYKDFAINDVTLVKQSEKMDDKQAMKHQVKVLDKDQLKFRSVFSVSSLFGFNPDKYVFRVNMGTISANVPVELEPVKMALKN